MNYAHFEEEESDIVKLVPDSDGASGWVNVGVFAVRIELDDEGNLEVEAFARTNEGAPLGGFRVLKCDAVSIGGADPDADEDEEAR